MCLHLFLYHFWFHSFKRTAGIFALLFIKSVVLFFSSSSSSWQLQVSIIHPYAYFVLIFFFSSLYFVFRVYVYHVSCFIFKLQSGLVD